MIFTNIIEFERRMDIESINVAFFSINYGECTVECVYAKNLRKFLFAIVDKNIGFTCSLDGLYASAYINHQEALQKLADCRNHGKWDPKHFYEILNNSLPHVLFTQTTESQYQRVAKVSISNFEDRIYFNHWRRANISPKQVKKREELLGHEVLNFCKTSGITPVYFPYPVDRTYSVMNDFKEDFHQYDFCQ